VRKAIVDFIGSDIVVAHFAQFDMGALKDVYQKYELDFDNIDFDIDILDMELYYREKDWQE